MSVMLSWLQTLKKAGFEILVLIFTGKAFKLIKLYVRKIHQSFQRVLRQ